MVDNEQNAEVTQAKIVKFRAIMERLQQYLWKSRDSGEVACVLMRPDWMNSYTDNPYISVLIGESLFSRSDFRSDSSISSVILDQRWCIGNPNKLSFDCAHVNGSYSHYDIIFWFFMLAAIDDRIYNDQLDYIVDVAYLLHFSEAMIRDWCRAVVYVLDGHTLSPDCDLTCETEEGKTFFLHQ